MGAAYEIPNLRFSGEAGGEIKRRRFVTVNATGAVVTAVAASAVIGVSSVPCSKAGEVAEIYDGIVMVEASAAIAPGAKLAPTADGRAVTATGDSANVTGIALTAASAAGELVTVKLK